MVVVAPLPSGSHRVVATLENAPEQPGMRDIQALIDSRGPETGRNTVKEVVWSSRFRIHHRVANAYRHGRLLLMGDAAHVHSPAGGQGMNTGLVDALVLGQLLAKIIKNGGRESLLDTYEQLRRPAAVQVLALAGRLTGLATVRGTLKRTLRNAVLSLMNVLPPVRRQVVMNLSGLSRKAFSMVTDSPSHPADAQLGRPRNLPLSKVI
jgi:2-polyprenyl-6-methoxyphenol hydroxylase-like FAD-dependent oxidoreductase